MLRIILLHPELNSHVELPFADGGVAAGFPSPGQEYISESIDLNHLLISNPAATFIAKVVGLSMVEEGIDEGDLVVVDRSINPIDGDLVICCLDGDFTLKRIHFTSHGVSLMPSNSHYSPIEVSPDSQFMVWGVVTHTIKSNRRPRRCHSGN